LPVGLDVSLEVPPSGGSLEIGNKRWPPTRRRCLQ